MLTDSVFVRVRYLDLSSSNLLPGRSLEEVGRDSWRLHGGQQQGDGAVHCLEGEGFVLKHLLIFCCELKQNTILNENAGDILSICEGSMHVSTNPQFLNLCFNGTPT